MFDFFVSGVISKEEKKVFFPYPSFVNASLLLHKHKEKRKNDNHKAWRKKQKGTKWIKKDTKNVSFLLQKHFIIKTLV